MNVIRSQIYSAHCIRNVWICSVGKHHSRIKHITKTMQSSVIWKTLQIWSITEPVAITEHIIEWMLLPHSPRDCGHKLEFNSQCLLICSHVKAFWTCEILKSYQTQIVPKSNKLRKNWMAHENQNDSRLFKKIFNGLPITRQTIKI